MDSKGFPEPLLSILKKINKMTFISKKKFFSKIELFPN